VLARYREYLPLTIRQVFYALVGAEQLEKTERAYERLCYALNQGRRSLRIPFDALRDDGVSVMKSRAYRGLQDFDDETARRAQGYRRDRQDGQPQRIELWCEAAGMVPQLASVAEDYSVPVYSAGGFASLSAVRMISERAVARGKPTLVLHVGDYDPSGESIFAAMTEDAAAFVDADSTLATSRLEAVRVALTAAQVADYGLPTAPAKASDSRSKGWTGGTCQLEALPPDLLADLVREAILGRFRINQYAAVLEDERNERAELLGLPSGEA
jgi:hypothetical protein